MRQRILARGLLLTGPALLASHALAQAPWLVLDGQQSGDRFGHAVSTAGDVDADGVEDWIVGAPFADTVANNAGSARVVSGATGQLLHQFDGEQADDWFGWAVGAAGDVNADGFDDLVIGAMAHDAGGADAGRAYVFGGRTGLLLYVFDGDAEYDNLGISVAGAGDVNHDGFADVIVGAWRSDIPGPDAGIARIFSGVDGSLLFELHGEADSDLFGTSVASAGDVNGDLRGDVIVGARWNDVGGDAAGSAHVFSGRDGSQLLTLRGAAAGDALGSSVSCAGDHDGDGLADLFVGSPGSDVNGSNSGSATVFSGSSGLPLLSFHGDAAGDNLGISVAGAGDVDGDGFPDLIAGAHGDDTNGQGAGMARVFSGFDSSILLTVRGAHPGDSLGFSVTRGGDINGDGVADVMAGAYGDSSKASLAGSAQVFSLNCPAATSFCPAAVNSTGLPATIGSLGSPSLSGNGFSLTCSGARPGMFGLFFVGTQTAAIPFGDGTRCVDGAIQRFDPVPIDAAGTVRFSVDLRNPHGSATYPLGEKRYFQFWFRDPGGPGGNGFNLSDGLEVMFCP